MGYNTAFMWVTAYHEPVNLSNLTTTVRFVPPNTEVAAEDELEPEPDSASEGFDPTLRQMLDGGFETKSPEAPLLPFHQRTSSQTLHRSDSNASKDLSGKIDFHAHSSSFLPSIANALSTTPSNRDVNSDAASQRFSVPPFERADSGTLLRGSVDWSMISPGHKHSSPSLSHNRSPNDVNHISPFSNSAFSPNSSLSLSWPVKDPFEAQLFHHYIVACSDWIDVCDSRRHFTREVPKRAAHFPIILNAILGVAARHLWLIQKLDKDRSQPYVDQCLQSLIIALEDPLAHWDENFLVAVILLRIHEEIGEVRYSPVRSGYV